jgi:hypothetical protein
LATIAYRLFFLIIAGYLPVQYRGLILNLFSVVNAGCLLIFVVLITLLCSAFNKYAISVSDYSRTYFLKAQEQFYI